MCRAAPTVHASAGHGALRSRGSASGSVLGGHHAAEHYASGLMPVTGVAAVVASVVSGPCLSTLTGAGRGAHRRI